MKRNVGEEMGKIVKKKKEKMQKEERRASTRRQKKQKYKRRNSTGNRNRGMKGDKKYWQLEEQEDGKMN